MRPSRFAAAPWYYLLRAGRPALVVLTCVAGLAHPLRAQPGMLGAAGAMPPGVKAAAVKAAVAADTGQAPSPRDTAVVTVWGLSPDAALASPAVQDTLEESITLATLGAAAAEWLGRSGKLLARFIAPAAVQDSPTLASLVGAPEAWRPGMRHLARDDRNDGPFTLVAMRGFDEKTGSTIAGYRVGFWPAERGRVRGAAYENPDGFIEVTPENQDLQVSAHFRLRDFLTKDQPHVWPKYLVLQERLLDKLELVIAELEASGIPATTVRVLSGFRHPSYNQALGEASGRATDSRHMYGDAADIYVDHNSDGRMDDLNRDGRLTFADVEVVLAAVTRVERRYPDLAGGTGLYRATGSHGPFAHIDVRGSTARWTVGPSSKRTRTMARRVSRARSTPARTSRRSASTKSVARRPAPAKVAKKRPTRARTSAPRRPRSTASRSSSATRRAKT